MKYALRRVFIILFITIILNACSSNTRNESFPIDVNTTENCAADGVGCKQFNEKIL